MKIVLLTQGFILNVGYQENLLFEAYQKMGHEVHVITSTTASLADVVDDRYDSEVAGSTIRVGNGTIYRLPWKTNFFNRIHRYPDITPILERIGPDLIFVHNILMNLTDCVRYVRLHPNCKLLLDYHGDYTNSASNWFSLKILHGIVRKRVLDRARPFLSRILPITPGGEKFLREVYRVPPEEMEMLPLGADLEFSRRIRASSARAELRAMHGIGENRLVIFTGGKLWPGRRTDALIKAIKGLPKESVYLVVIGEATSKHREYRAMLDEMIADQSNVLFTGWLGQEDIYRHMAMADVAVFPASQSVLWQQCIGMGLPLVIGDPARGLQDISYLNLHGNVLVADEGPPLELSLRSVLERVLADRELLRNMSLGADKTASEALDWNALAARTLRFNHEA